MLDNLCCPQCFGILNLLSSELICNSCKKEFKIIADVPDLRVFPPTEVSFHNDLKDALYLDRFSKNNSFRDLILENAKLSKSDGKIPAFLIDMYEKMSLSAENREEARFKEIDFVIKKCNIKIVWDKALDLGTGMGPAIPILANRFENVTAMDISLKHTVIAKKRCQEKGYKNIQTICACSERLPFSDSSFSFVYSSDVLEHVTDYYIYLKEILRILKPGGILWSSTPNRFSILPEGHVKLWGIGFLPRKLQIKVVRKLRNIDYESIQPVSYFELKRALSYFFKLSHIILPSEMHALIEPHPGLKISPLWKFAKTYWNIVEKSQLLNGISKIMEISFYPQFRFVAIK